MKKTTHSKSRSAGFTLIEIMVVVLIVGLLLGTVGTNVWNSLFKSQYKIAENQIRLFQGAIDMYKSSTFKYPESLEVLAEPDPISGEPIIKRIPLDPWNNEYMYEFDSDNRPVITCYGADGAPGGENMDADISSETIDE
ncbi:MAG: general secretion pathway protein G [Myxococcota bacterium]|jgi:general secretion pathway protein G